MRPTWERGVIGLVVLSVAAKVFVAAGLPASVAAFLRVLTAGAVIAALFLNKSGSRWLDVPRAILLLLALYYLPSVHTRVGGDGVEYYVQSRSLLFDGDLELQNDYRGLGAPPIRSAQGEVTSRFPVGLPLFWIPPLWLTHVSVTVASWLGAEVSTDGFSPVYQVAVNVATYLYGFVALLLLESALRRRHGRGIALLVVAAVWLATPLHFYMSANPFMSHGTSVLLATCFVLSWLKARENDNHAMWAVSGVFGGLMMLVRVQDGALLVMPVVDLVLGGRPQRWRLLVAFLAGPLLCGLFQAAIWFYLYGWGFVSVVFVHGKIARTQPHIGEFLFSPRHGLLTWTPVFLGSLIGWGILSKRSPRLGLGVWLAFLMAVAINSSTEDWWGSESFGQRRMLGMIPVMAFGLGIAFDYFRRRPLIPLTLAVVGLIGWNLQLGYIYNAELVSKRDEAATLDRVAAAQVDVLYRKLLRSQEWMPRALWVLLYDNLKGVWIDEGARSLNRRIDLGNEPEGYFPLVGEGWFPPESNDEQDRAAYRLSRGRRSWLTVPIRRPKDSRIVVRARLERPEVQARLAVDVNGENVGEEALGEDWSDHVFAVPKELLRPGLNQIIFTYSATPRTVIPDFHGRNATAAVDWVEFRR